MNMTDVGYSVNSSVNADLLLWATMLFERKKDEKYY